jgi:excisionase family DNA binding protein
MVTGSSRPPLGANVRGPSAWIVWQTARDSLLSRLRQLEVNPNVDRSIVRGFRNTIDDLELAAHGYRDWELVRNAADSVEVDSAGADGDSGCPPQRWGVGKTAASLNCSPRWVTALIAQGRLAAVKHGREWRVDVDSVEDFKRRGADAA